MRKDYILHLPKNTLSKLAVHIHLLNQQFICTTKSLTNDRKQASVYGPFISGNMAKETLQKNSLKKFCINQNITVADIIH